MPGRPWARTRWSMGRRDGCGSVSEQLEGSEVRGRDQGSEIRDQRSEIALVAIKELLMNSSVRAVARRLLIRGDVQGVGYRFFAQRAAARHQVVGYVKNLPDGSVEALVEGPRQSVEAFKHELATGPRFAIV